MSSSSDDEIANDEENGLNKLPCKVEKTLERCQTTGFDRRGLQMFEGQLRGKLITIIFVGNKSIMPVFVSRSMHLGSFIRYTSCKYRIHLECYRLKVLFQGAAL